MKLGLLGRAEDRGLGVMSLEFFRHMNPDRTLVVDMGPLARGFPMHLDRFPGATVVPYNGGTFDEYSARRWLKGLDCLYVPETPYDFRLLTWAEESGTATIVHTMPEFFHWARNPDLPRPTVWWNPTTWRSHLLPDEVQTVPVPVAMDRFDELAQRRNANEKNAIPTFAHVAGHRAMADRNGTRTFLMALRHLTAPMRVLVLGQDRRMPSRGAVSRVVTVESRLGGVADYWRLYEGADVLVMPRRYGGLALPVQEAMGAGLAIVMTDTEPQRSTWPVDLVPSTPTGSIETSGGTVELVEASPRALARAMDLLATDLAWLNTRRIDARKWALRHSWERLRPLYETKLAEACVLAEERRRCTGT